MRRALGVIAAALAVMAMGTPAHAEPAGNPIVEIKSVGRGTCVEPSANYLVLGACDGSPEQQWEKAPVADGKFVLRNLGNRTCVLGTSTFSPWPCDVEDADQFGELVPAGGDTVRLKYNDRYADVYNYDSSGHVALFLEYETDHQRWQVTEVGRTAPPADTAGKVVHVRSVSEENCLGATVSRVACADTDEQSFGRVELGDGWFQLRNTATGHCLANSGPYSISADQACTADVAQRWQFDVDQLGYVKVRNDNGRFLTPLGPEHTGLYDYASVGTWQKWEVTVR